MKTTLEMGWDEWDEWDNSGFSCVQWRTKRESSMLGAFPCGFIKPAQSVWTCRILKVLGLRSYAISYLSRTRYISTATCHVLSVQCSPSESGILCLLAIA